MTLKQIRQWAAAVAAICLINVFLPFYGITAYAATARIAFSDPTASVGSEINVKMKITSSDNLSTADIMLAYDANSLEFIEGTNAEGGNGAVRVHGDGGAGNTTTLAYDLKFKASAAGTSKITVTSQEIYDSSSKIVTVDKQGESQVTVSALASASKDATLKSLQVSPGSLTPEFSSDVDSYAVTVGTDVDKLIISADYVYQNWGGRNKGYEMTGVSGKDKTSYKVEYTNTSTFKVGVEYTPNRYDIRHFLKRWSYRAGFRYGSYNQTFNGDRLAQYAVTAGIGIPVKLWAVSGIDVGVEYGRRGYNVADRLGLVRQQYFKFAVGFTLFAGQMENGEYWFMRSKFD